MLDKQDLQAIRDLVKEESAQSQAETMGKTSALDAKLAQSRQEIMQGVSVLMESDFRPQFDLLAEGQQAILEKLGPLDDWEVMDTRVSALEAMVRKLNREVAALKKAQ